MSKKGNRGLETFPIPSSKRLLAKYPSITYGWGAMAYVQGFLPKGHSGHFLEYGFLIPSCQSFLWWLFFNEKKGFKMLYVVKDILPYLPERAVVILSILPIREQMLFEAVYLRIPKELRYDMITSRLILEHIVTDHKIREIIRDDPPWTRIYWA